ncbi:MAG: glycosyltransferase family 2 protein [Candidatus Pacearchaeota archaeon]|jgi:glycosyltransferase involved in cell wall biosynthesis
MKADNILVSINIPTYNSESTLEETLKSIKAQTYKNYEIIIADHNSKDKTVEIAKKYTNKIILDSKKLLHSRYLAFKASKGKIIFFIDSDQILEPTLIERVVKSFKEEDYDMWALEERSYRPKNWVEKLTDVDRENVHKIKEFNPSKSVILARAFKKELLEKAFKKISPKLFDYVSVQDHAIIYYECWKISNKILMIKNAVFHKEPNSIRELYHHYFRWGVTAQESLTALPKEYNDMFSGKLENRIKFHNFFDTKFLIAFPITFTKGFGYTLGMFYAKNIKKK